ncbi:MAG TPA: polysaccharide deacetylase family protein [Candidatus Limiplasma stercoravium]|nr:polysaccharide deacetylase family protein [Candidatus Limiplasma stercoravium]
MLQSQPRATPSRDSPLKRLPSRLRGLLTRKALTQAGLVAALLALCTVYTAGLNDNAAAVVAAKRELPIYSVEHDDKVISISFDASWGADKTLSLLDILDEHNVKTTFFLVGGWVDKYPDMVQAIVARGHEIGNHSNTHPHMNALGEQAIRDELRMMSDKVENLTGVRPTLFRPPYGEYNNRVVQVARQEGYEVVQWSIDSLDWKDRGTEDIIKQCTYRVDNGDIVLFHNDSNDILNALPTVIKHYQSLGYTIVPVSELLLEGPYTIDVQGKQHPAATAEPKQ